MTATAPLLLDADGSPYRGPSARAVRARLDRLPDNATADDVRRVLAEALRACDDADLSAAGYRNEAAEVAADRDILSARIDRDRDRIAGLELTVRMQGAKINRLTRILGAVRAPRGIHHQTGH